MRELHPRRLGQGQSQFFLKVLVHHVNHPVAESPKSKQQDEQNEGEEHVPPVIRDEHFLSGSGARIVEWYRMVSGRCRIHDSLVCGFTEFSGRNLSLFICLQVRALRGGELSCGERDMKYDCGAVLLMGWAKQ